MGWFSNDTTGTVYSKYDENGILGKSIFELKEYLKKQREILSDKSEKDASIDTSFIIKIIDDSLSALSDTCDIFALFSNGEISVFYILKVGNLYLKVTSLVAEIEGIYSNVLFEKTLINNPDLWETFSGLFVEINNFIQKNKDLKQTLCFINPSQLNYGFITHVSVKGAPFTFDITNYGENVNLEDNFAAFGRECESFVRDYISKGLNDVTDYKSKIDGVFEQNSLNGDGIQVEINRYNFLKKEAATCQRFEYQRRKFNSFLLAGEKKELLREQEVRYYNETKNFFESWAALLNENQIKNRIIGLIKEGATLSSDIEQSLSEIVGITSIRSNASNAANRLEGSTIEVLSTDPVVEARERLEAEREIEERLERERLEAEREEKEREEREREERERVERERVERERVERVERVERERVERERVERESTERTKTERAKKINYEIKLTYDKAIREYPDLNRYVEKGPGEIYSLKFKDATCRNIKLRSILYKLRSKSMDKDHIKNLPHIEITFASILGFLRAGQEQNKKEEIINKINKIETEFVKIEQYLQKDSYAIEEFKYSQQNLLKYLDFFVRYPSEDNLQILKNKFAYELHSFDDKVVDQDKKFFDRNIFTIIATISIIGWLVMGVSYAATYFATGNPHLFWDSSTAQDAQSNIIKDIDELSNHCTLAR